MAAEIIQFQGRRIVLNYTEPEEYDFDMIAQVHYDNLIGELLTLPKVVNDFGMLSQQLQTEVKRLQLEIELEKDDLQEIKAKLQPTARDYCKTERKINSPTKDDIESYIITQSDYKAQKDKIVALQEKLIELEGAQSRVNTAHWSAKYKLDNVGKIADAKPHDLFLREGKINGVYLQDFNNLEKE